MSLPAGIVAVTVTGSQFGGGGDAKGSVEFTPGRVLYATLKKIGLATKYTAPIVAGAFSIVLPAADDAGGNPTGWTYKVTERTQGGSSYNILLLATNGPVQDLSALAPVASITGTPVVVGPAGPIALTESPPGSGLFVALLSENPAGSGLYQIAA